MSAFNNLGNMESQIMNTLEYQEIYLQLKIPALMRRIWDIPKTCNAKYIENELFEVGVCGFFNNELYGIKSIGCTAIDGYDINGNYLKMKPTRNEGNHIEENGISQTILFNELWRDYEPEDCVEIKNNYLRNPTKTLCTIYALKLYHLSRAHDINCEKQSLPWIIKARDKKEENQLNILLNNIDSKRHAIMVDRELMDTQSDKIIVLNTPFIADKLTIERHKILSEYLLYLGIKSANQDKKERLVESEVAINDQITEIYKSAYLEPCVEACAAATAKFGTPFNVRWREIEVKQEVSDTGDV